MIHFPNLHYLQEKILISETMQEVVMWILIHIKKEHNNNIS